MTRRRDDLVIGPKEKAIEAVRAGNKEEAIKNIETLYEEFRPLHDRYGDWIQILLSFIAEKLGEEAIEEAIRRITYEVYKEKWLTAFKNMSAEEIAAMAVYLASDESAFTTGTNMGVDGGVTL